MVIVEPNPINPLNLYQCFVNVKVLLKASGLLYLNSFHVYLNNTGSGRSVLYSSHQTGKITLDRLL